VGETGAEDQAGDDHGLERGFFAHANLIVVIFEGSRSDSPFLGGCT
jgi:hypothetical protein